MIMNLSKSNLTRIRIFLSRTSLAPVTSSILIHKYISLQKKSSSSSSLMPPKPSPTDLPTHTFPTAHALETFLEHNHATSPGIYLKLAKKASGIPSITPAEAVETALCFGWIDGRANALDDNYWLVRYTPRRPKSIWSQKNVATVGRLVESGRMRAAGLAAVEAAKEDGRWERAYAGPKSMGIPEDFESRLAREPGTRAFFEGLKRSERYAVLWRVETATPGARGRRIEALVEMLKEGRVPGDKAVSGGRSGKRKLAGESKVDESESRGRRRRWSARVAAKMK